MSNDGLDFSIGLASSLELLETYRQSGALSAIIQHAPGIGGPCRIWIRLVEGKVVSCSLEDGSRRQYSVDKKALIRLDAERGPFSWTFLTAIATGPQEKVISLPSPVPRPIAPLNPAQLRAWSAKDRIILSSVFMFIDGRRSVADIKERLSLSSDTVDRALRILRSTGAIEMDEK